MASKFDKVEKCYAFFLQCYETKATFDLQDVAAATGWSFSTVRTYSTKRWDSFLRRVAEQFQVTDYFSTFTPETFIQHHSQKDIVKKYFYQLLVEKSLSACISAIEIYNKPDFKFREESFSILMVNAWELLLKAKILQLNYDDIGSIWYWKSGEPERGPSGNPKTIAVSKAISILTGNGALKPIVAESIKLLIEVRDESIHFIHDDMDLGTKIQGLGTAALKNFMTLAMDWFGVDFRQFNFYLMPVSFFHLSDVESFSVDSEASANLLNYLNTVERSFDNDNDSEFSLTLRLETKFVKTSSEEALLVRLSDDPDAAPIQITEEDALKSYPFTYEILCFTARQRYQDFKQNQKFYELMRLFKSQGEKFCKQRRLDPTNPKSLYKEFYHSRIVEELDKHYTKKKLNGLG